jgi:hypothetical protein
MGWGGCRGGVMERRSPPPPIPNGAEGCVQHEARVPGSFFFLREGAKATGVRAVVMAQGRGAKCAITGESATAAFSRTGAPRVPHSGPGLGFFDEDGGGVGRRGAGGSGSTERQGEARILRARSHFGFVT